MFILLIRFRPFPVRIAFFAACLVLAACRLGVEDATTEPDPVPGKDLILEKRTGTVSDTSDEVREMLAASTRPKAVIHWLDNDSAWSGEYRGMVLDVEASWPEYTIVFRHPEGFFDNSDLRKPRYRFGFLSLANDGDGDGLIFAWTRNGRSGTERVEAPDSLAAEYLRFQQQVDSISTCRENSCKQAKAAALEAWSDGLEASALENGFRAARRKGGATDWYLGENGRILVIWIPDSVALVQVHQNFDNNCAGSGNKMEIGYNFRAIDRPFPRMKESFESERDSTGRAGELIFWAGVEDLSDRRITFECHADAWSSFDVSHRMFKIRPPEFQLGFEDLPPWK